MFRFLALAFAVVAILPAHAEDRKAIDLHDGKSLNGWKARGDAKRSKWVVGTATFDAKEPGKLKAVAAEKGGDLVNPSSGVDLYSEKKFGDCLIELEVMVPKGSNSGIYVMGEYEVQILDSWGKAKVGTGDMGGIYATSAPKSNASKKPGEWQTFAIEFRAPRFDAGKKTANAKFVKVTLNGTVIHENVEVKGPTPSCLTNKEHAEGPLLFQGDHGPVAFRNIRVTPR